MTTPLDELRLILPILEQRRADLHSDLQWRFADSDSKVRDDEAELANLDERISSIRFLLQVPEVPA